MYSEKFLKNSIKLLKSPFPVMLQSFFYSKSPQKALRHSKVTRGELQRHSKSTTRALGHSRHSDTRRALGHSGTQDTWHSALSTRRSALGHSAHRHSGTRGTRGTLFSRLTSLSIFQHCFL